MWRLLRWSLVGFAAACACYFVPDALLPASGPTAPNWLFFDGVCNLCDGFVQFVADHNGPQSESSRGRVMFGAIQRHGELMAYHGAGAYAEGGAEALTTLVLVQASADCEPAPVTRIIVCVS